MSTLKEKFLPKMYCFMGSGMLSNTYDEKISEYNAKECEVIAEEFAIGFAEFCFINSLSKYPNNNYKELLEMYKKEKGL